MPLPRFDLRSDTVTRPTAAMRAAMAGAEVGDDVYREDPTTRRLEERVAEIVGKEAALFVPSGTMSNQIALLVHTRPGSEVIVGEGAHLANFESGAAAAWSGVQFAVAGRGGLFGAADVRALIRPDAIMYPPTSLVTIENTHNRGGGKIFPQSDVVAVADEARRQHLALHLDGSRLWNAAVASGRSEAELSAPFDTVTVCFSKGLGAPVGSAFVGSREHVERGRRLRKMLGGGMRQSGVLAAAALHGLEHHRPRLADDHRAARRIAEILAGSARLACDPRQVETNIVLVGVPSGRAADVGREAQELGVLCHVLGPDALRLVTHLDLPGDAADEAATLVTRAAERAHRVG